MFGQTFYHRTTRLIVSAFGTLFNDISIERKDSTNTTIQTIKVPISYGPKQRWFYRDVQDPNAGNVSNDATQTTQLPVQAVFPRMTYELTGIDYLADKKGMTTLKNVALGTDNTTLKRAWNPVPVRFALSLYIVAKNVTDGLQIVEQIVPYFTPDFTVRIQDESDLSIVHDVPYVLQYPLKLEDNWDGDFKERREIVWELNFIADGRMYGPVETQKIIIQSTVHVLDDISATAPNDAVVITPNPSNSMPNTNFGFTETITHQN